MSICKCYFMSLSQKNSYPQKSLSRLQFNKRHNIWVEFAIELMVKAPQREKVRREKGVHVRRIIHSKQRYAFVFYCSFPITFIMKSSINLINTFSQSILNENNKKTLIQLYKKKKKNKNLL